MPIRHTAHDTFKFSLFGGIRGSSFQLEAGTTRLGARVKWALKGTSAGVLLNADVPVAGICSTGVAKLKLVETARGRRTLHIDFPTTHDVGTDSNYVVPTATRDFNVKASSISGEIAINIDYLVDTADLNTAGKWLIYDFTVALGENWYEQFRIWLDGESIRALHPGSSKMPSGSAAPGPDEEADGGTEVCRGGMANT